jgi:hypothetical protein
MTSKEALHALIDTLPDTKLDAARLYLEALRAEDDPVLQAFLNAPEDDEPETDEERAAVQEAREALARGDVYTLAEVSRELGL